MSSNGTAVAYLGLGSNLEQPAAQLDKAIQLLNEQPGISVVKQSSYYGSKPHGPQDQPDFVNAVVCITTSLAPLELLDCTQAIERNMGRIKTRHWGERIIDVDIVLYENRQFHHERLTIPHVQLDQREFVIVPLLELEPELVLPDGRKLRELPCKAHLLSPLK